MLRFRQSARLRRRQRGNPGDGELMVALPGERWTIRRKPQTRTLRR
ncbi:hypothetical protein ACVXG8_01105 [Escherichia coli]